ncbi:MAG: hypothetical protein ACUVRJ_06320 [Candidatus Villigracilaceae bacterium]
MARPFPFSVLFQKTVDGRAAAEIFYRNEQVTVSHVLHPAIPIQLLIAPNRHLLSINTPEEIDGSTARHLIGRRRMRLLAGN